MSGLWTPSGEHVPSGDVEPETDDDFGDDLDEELTEEEVAEELRRVRAEISSTPVADIVANHAVGLWQLAVLHLTPEAALVEGLGDRLGEHAQSLRDGLTQLRLAFVELQNRAG